MPRSSSHPVPAPLGSAGDLVRLLETEQMLATRLEATRSECSAIVARARETAALAEQHLDADVARERDTRARELAQETAARIATVEASARDRAALFTAASAQDVDRLAEAVLGWLAEPDGGPG